MSPNNPWGVLFDADGVLINSYRAHFESWRVMLLRYGYTMTEEQFASTFGQKNHVIFGQLYPEIPESRYAALGEEKEAEYRTIVRADFPAMPGAANLLRALHAAGVPMAIGSSGPRENVQVVLDLLDGAEHIRATVNGSEVDHGKPEPDVFLQAAGKIGIPPERCIVFEDAPAGVAAGKNAGCAVVALTGTSDREGLSHADWVIDHLKEVTPDRLRELLPK